MKVLEPVKRLVDHDVTMSTNPLDGIAAAEALRLDEARNVE